MQDVPALVRGLLQGTITEQHALILKRYTLNALFSHPLFNVQGQLAIAGIYTSWGLANKHLDIQSIHVGK